MMAPSIKTRQLHKLAARPRPDIAAARIGFIGILNPEF
jgi:hypothetical protein